MKTSSAKSKPKYLCRRCKQPFKWAAKERICKVCKTRCSGCGSLLTPDTIDQSCLKLRKAYKCKICVAKGVREHKNPASQREYDLLRNYGISVEEYENILKLQDGVCYICSSPPKKTRLAVDHKHQPNEKKLRQEKGHALIRKNVRGLLCWHCNHALGAFKDNPHHLKRAAEYLEKWPAQEILKDDKQ